MNIKNKGKTHKRTNSNSGNANNNNQNNPDNTNPNPNNQAVNARSNPENSLNSNQGQTNLSKLVINFRRRRSKKLSTKSRLCWKNPHREIRTYYCFDKSCKSCFIWWSCW